MKIVQLKEELSSPDWQRLNRLSICQIERRVIWPEDEPDWRPFWADAFFVKDQFNFYQPGPVTCRVIAYVAMRNTYLAVRTDRQPLMWVWWWLIYRLQESSLILLAFLIRLVEIWELADVEPGRIPSLQDIKPVRFLSNQLKRLPFRRKINE